MCKNLNIGIVSFLIIGLVMSGCIRKLNLYQEDRDEDENKDNGKRRDVIYEMELIYPFDNETTDKEIETTIHLKVDRQVGYLYTEIPTLKYNKDWLFLMTQDDCMHSASSYTWAVIHGRPLPYTYYCDLVHLQNGDLPSDYYSLGKILVTTNGTGQEACFSFGTTAAADDDLMNTQTQVQSGYTRDYFHFHKKIMLVWGSLQGMTNYGVSIAFRDLSLPDEDKTEDKLLAQFPVAQSMIREKLNNRTCKMPAEPNGDKSYIKVALRYDKIRTLCAQSGATKLHPFQENGDTEQVVIERTFYDPPEGNGLTNPDMIEAATLKEMENLKEERVAVSIGAHNTDTGWVNSLEWLNDTCGRDGDDSMWFTNQEEYYEYHYYRLHSKPETKQVNAHTWKPILNLSGEDSAPSYCPSVTVNIFGFKMENIENIKSNEDVTGPFHGNHEDFFMLNIDCQKYLTERAENFVKRYEMNPIDVFAKADANYFVNMLKDLDKKMELEKRIKQMARYKTNCQVIWA